MKYKPGTEIANANGLSRLPCDPPREEEAKLCEVLFLESVERPPMQAAEIARLLEKDIIARVLSWVWKGWPNECLSDEFNTIFFTSFGIISTQRLLIMGMQSGNSNRNKGTCITSYS